MKSLVSGPLSITRMGFLMNIGPGVFKSQRSKSQLTVSARPATSQTEPRRSYRLFSLGVTKALIVVLGSLPLINPFLSRPFKIADYPGSPKSPTNHDLEFVLCCSFEILAWKVLPWRSRTTLLCSD